MKATPLPDRMFAKLETVPTTGCIEFTGARTRKNYGLIHANGKTSQAHRVAWILAFGPIPDGMLVCHRCDNPPCCNPDHPVLGHRSTELRRPRLERSGP